MSEPRKHHYVPVFYQKHFADSKGLFWVYDRRLKSYKQLPPTVVCFEKDLYALKPTDGGPRDRRVETKGLSQVDGVGATAIRDLLFGNPNTETIRAVSFFMGVQFSRLPSMGRSLGAMYVQAGREMMRLMTASVDRMKGVLEKYARDTGESIGVSAESMVAAVRENQIEVLANEVPFLNHLFSQAEDLSNVVEQLEWQLLISPPETGFITCDSPVTVVPPMGTKAVGFGIPGAVKYFPLARQFCLRVGDVGFRFTKRKVSEDTVQIVNWNIAANSEHFIMGPDKAQLQSVVRSSQSEDEDSSPRFTVEVQDQNDDGSLQKITFQPRRYFYRKSAAP
ncbi:MAG TPA: DUF4238 domain-containing protein [Candidatus Acidoferrales bacterium]|nr:DUF4238 domain-containing protein [Candidatus Acidoferrales bacterium]